MANPSPFLQYQDKNGDFLIDDCEIKLPGPVEKVCLDCVPNPRALVEDWKTNLGYPFLNGKLCLYQVGVQTNFTSTGDQDTGTSESLTEKFEFHKEDAIELYLDEYEKASSLENIEALRENIFYDVSKDFDLPARSAEGSRLSLLYSVPFDVLENLEDATDDEEEDELEPVEVTYLASEMPILLTRINKGLNLYGRYRRADNVMNGSSLLFTETRSPFKIENYGSAGFGNTSELSKAYSELDRWLNTKGFNLYGFSGAGTGGFGKDRVLKLTLGFNRERKLKKIKVFSLACREKPKVFKGRKLSGLNRKDVFKDRTAMNYLSRLAEMERDLTARKPKNYVDFIQEHTYPEVSFFNNQELIQNETSCVRNVIEDRIQGLGEAFLDEVLGIGDIIAYQFHQHACKNEKEESDLMKEFGEIYETAGAPIDEAEPPKTKKNGKDKKTGVLSKGSRKTMKTMAMQQALEKLEQNPNVFVQLCGSFFATRTGLAGTLGARDMWDFSFNQIKLCGLLDFLLDALGCLWGGLELEEALRIALTSALQAMGLKDFGSLFAGLPPEEQAELDALVKMKLAESRQKADTVQTAAQDQERDSVDTPEPRREESGFFGGTFGEISFVKPFEDPELLEKEEAARAPGSYENTTVSKSMYEAQGNNFGTRPRIGTIYNNAQELSGRQTPSEDTIKSVAKRAEETFNTDEIMQAYFAALVEYYSGRLLDLVDRLNEFPGAEVISKILAIIDCPRPPLFTPSVMDFLKDIELPFCNNVGDIALPKLFRPNIDWADLWKRILAAIKEAIIQIVINILFKLIVKICEIIGDAICKALETTGRIAGNLGGLLTGNTTIKDIVRESICGPGATDDQVNDSIAEMFAAMGGAGANLANKDRVLALNEAIASTSTRQEIIDASLGNASEQFLATAEVVIADFPEFSDAFPNRQAIANFFSNIGDLIPPEVKNSLEDLVGGTYDNLDLPANPTLCATPEQIEEFCSIRSQILEGRASDAQIAQLCSNTLPADDFADLNDILQNGIPDTIMANMPPILSDPGCSNGLFDREPEVLVEQASNSLSSDLENLKVAYSFDMLGNGLGKKNWGYMNMVLSDTLGRPFTNHMRNVNRFKLFGGQRYVDFYVDQSKSDEGVDDTKYAKLERQKGAFPVYVGEWMADYWNGAPDTIKVNKPNNELTNKKTFRVESNDNITALYDYGYNMKYEPTEDGYKVIRRKRKSQADIVLSFRDNRQGEGDQTYNDSNMTIGYNFKFFFAEVLGGKNTQDNNVRVSIIQRTNEDNFKEDFKRSLEKEFETEAPEDDDKKNSNKVTSNRLFEFVGSDGGVDELLEQVGNQFESPYPRFETSLQEKGDQSPLIVLMSEMLGIPDSEAKSYWQSTTEQILESFGKKIFNYNTNKSFMYGANPDSITAEDADYGVVRGGEFKLYSDVRVDGEPLTNDDSVLGISRDQFKNKDKARIYYLDPNKFGGSFTNPKVYIKPVDNEGLLGLVNVMFPELSPCKPQNTDLVDFSDIASRISNSYANYPDDPRLAGDPDCIVEKPFDRVLSRAAKSGIEGTIAAACRIFASVHFLRTINTFSVIKPDFKNNMSTMYASFILEDMEKEMKDEQGFLTDLFNPFKDDEFWYAFLEQSVQTYFQMVQSGKITEVPSDVERALERIGAAQNKYKYPGRDAMKKAKKVRRPRNLLQTLPQFREDRNLAAVKSVEEDCKLILKEFMVQEVNFLADLFYRNMITERFIDKDDYIYNVMYYILSSESGLTNGSSLDMSGEIREEIVGIPTGSNQYTDGDMLALEDGTPYVGYYHTHVAEEDGSVAPEVKQGDILFMVGEEHSEEPHDLLRPFANKVEVNIGNVSGASSSGGKPFYIRKYIKVNGARTYDSEISSKVDALKSGGDSLVSELYPGTLEYIYDAGSPESIRKRIDRVTEDARAEGREPTEEELTAAREGEGRPIVGLKGELGVRYGLELRASTGGLIANSEIDVLDLPLSMLKPLEGGSKELLCLINKLIDDPKFKLFMDYALPIRKMVSALAIYNDTVYLQSIGQISTGQKNDGRTKPGITVNSNRQPITETIGWFPKDDRPGGIFVLTWDEWNRVAIEKSVSVIKKMFKSYYYSREFGKQERPDPTAAKVAIQNLKEKFKFAPGDRSVPWFRRRASNPFDANGKLCDRKED